MGQILICKRRKIASRRFEVSLDVQIMVLNGEVPPVEGIGVMRNLSLRGGCIETHAKVTAGDQLTLCVTFPNRTDEIEITTGVVRWVHNRQIRVEFLKLERSMAKLLMTYLATVHGAAQSKSGANDIETQ